MEINFIPLDYDYFDFEGRNYVRIIGRDDKGKRACVIDNFLPYFYAILKPNIAEKRIKEISEKIEKFKVETSGRTSRVEKTEIEEKNFLGKKVKAIKIFITNYKDAHPIADKLDFEEIEARREYDLSLITKYIIERKLTPLSWHKISGEILADEFGINNLDVDLCLKAEKIEKIEKQEFKPKILAFDIEADEFEIGKGEILMISLVSENLKKVLTYKKCSKAEKYVECCKNEAEMLEKFVSYVKKESPDFLVGYFSDGFDLPYLRARAEKNKVKLALGLDNSQPTFTRGIIHTGKISGIIHIDLFRFIEANYAQYLQSETLGLNEVASELIGEGKKDFDRTKKSSSIKQEEWQEYFSYNLQDSLLVYRLFEKLWTDLSEFSKVLQEPSFNVSRDRMAQHIEDYIIHNLYRFNEIAEKRPVHEEIGKRRQRERNIGAFVLQPKAGLYQDVVLFDFTSMHTSILVSFNISGPTLIKKEDKKENCFETPEFELDNKKQKFCFSKNPGFIPLIAKELMELRKKYKLEYKANQNPISKARSNAFKVLSAAVHGYLGFFGARYYSLEAAGSILAFVRKFNQDTIEKIKKSDYNVIYSDSVSGDTKIFVREKGAVYEKPIKELFERANRIEFGKEYDDKSSIEILTLDAEGNSIFCPIKYVMRHKSDKKMYRVHFTNNWYIDVTEDHSLIGYQSNKYNQSKKNKENPLNRLIEIKPQEIKRKADTIISLKKVPYEIKSKRNYPKEVYEFMGYFAGDGSFMRNKANQKANKDYYLRLSLGTDKNEVLTKLIKPLMSIGYIKNFWWSKTRKGDITLNGLRLVDIITNNFRDKNNKKIIPSWLFDEEEENICTFLRGLFSADGCVMIRNNAPIIKYTSIEDSYICSVRKLLYRAGISHSVFKENLVNKYKTKEIIYCSGTYSKNIIIKDKETFLRKIGFIIERKNKKGNIKTYGQQKKLIKQYDFDMQGVKNIEEIIPSEYVYDIEVEGNHRFFANYVLVHNTDSVAFERTGKSKEEVFHLLKKINSELPGVMELELEDFYKRGLWVTKRTGEFGAKKKYALITEKGKLKIRGFETVRRDWCNLARKLQNQVLEKILKEGNEKEALEILKKTIKELKERKVDKKEIIIRTQLKKPLNEYKAITPHVIAARKMKESGMPIDIGMLVSFFIAETREKKKLVREKVKLPDEKGEYNLDYYLKHQLLPAVENIFEVFNINIKELIEGKGQKKLF